MLQKLPMKTASAAAGHWQMQKPHISRQSKSRLLPKICGIQFVLGICQFALRGGQGILRGYQFILGVLDRILTLLLPPLSQLPTPQRCRL